MPFILIFCLALPGTFGADMAALGGSSSIQVKLDAQVRAYTLQEGDLGHALIRFAQQFNIPMGIEWARSPLTTKTVSRSWKSASVQQMLTDLVKSQRDYRVETSDGIVHVFPASLKSSRKNFLNLPVESLEIDDQVVEIARHVLREIVRAKTASREPGSQPAAGAGYSQAANTDDPEFSLALHNVSVRVVLDKIALASDRKIWVVTFDADASMTPAGYLRTSTLWNNSEVPNSEQPVWDSFRWRGPSPSVGPQRLKP